MEPSRRKLITGLIAFGCTPAIVRASSLMPVKVMETSIFDVIEDDLLDLQRYGQMWFLNQDGKFITVPHNEIYIK